MGFISSFKSRSLCLLRLALVLPCVVIEEYIVLLIELLLQLVHTLPAGRGRLLEVGYLVYYSLQARLVGLVSLVGLVG